MTQSMTGYGQAHWQGEGLAVFVEVSAVNARHFRLHPRLPHDLAAAERDLAKLIRKRLARGSVNLFVKVELTGAQAARPINQDALASYVRQLRQVGRELDVPVTFTADALAALPGVLASDELSSADHEALVGHVTDALERALDELSHMREAEGAHLRQELLRHNDAVERVVGQLERGLPDALDLYASGSPHESTACWSEATSRCPLRTWPARWPCTPSARAWPRRSRACGPTSSSSATRSTGRGRSGAGSSFSPRRWPAR